MMEWADMLSGALAVVIFLYLLVALFRPEKF
ncbi:MULTISPECIES: K(+)-transporting ATPase subunit F [unclassified Cupriavidus]